MPLGDGTGPLGLGPGVGGRGLGPCRYLYGYGYPPTWGWSTPWRPFTTWFRPWFGFGRGYGWGLGWGWRWRRGWGWGAFPW